MPSEGRPETIYSDDLLQAARWIEDAASWLRHTKYDRIVESLMAYVPLLRKWAEEEKQREVPNA